MYGAEFLLSDKVAREKYPAAALAKSVAVGAGMTHPRAMDGDLNRYVAVAKQKVPRSPFTPNSCNSDLNPNPNLSLSLSRPPAGQEQQNGDEVE